jgi:hypothetical protein
LGVAIEMHFKEEEKKRVENLQERDINLKIQVSDH